VVTSGEGSAGDEPHAARGGSEADDEPADEADAEPARRPVTVTILPRARLPTLAGVRRAVAIVGGWAVLLLAACSGGSSAAPTTATSLPASTTSTPPRGNVDGQLKLGILLPQTGDGAPIGASMATAINMAIAEINKAGGVNRRPVQVVAEDEGSDPETAGVALDDLITKKHVDAIIGPLSSKVALAVIDKIVEQHVVTCSPGATANALTDYPDEGYFFRTMPSDALQANALGRAISGTGLASTAIITPDDDYGSKFVAPLETELGRNGIKFTVTTYDPTASDFGGVVASALSGNPEAVAVIGLPDPGGKIIADLRAAGASPPGTAIFVTDGMRQADLFEKVQPGHPESVDGIEGTSPAVEPPGALWFANAYKAYAPNMADLYGSYAYDCANLIALAAQTAGTDDPQIFKDQVVPTSKTGFSCPNYAECVKALREGRGIDLDGASGPIELRDNGDPSFGWFDLFAFGADGKDSLKTQILVNPDS
jgi:branched-chain amino acid transport system substrate-binding protein